MAVQTVFKRYELKYLLTTEQKEKVLKIMQPHLHPDQYGRTTIRNLYYDRDDYLLIRRSIEKPAYKEKLRIRSYARASGESPVFVELKKKFEDVVYKRRICLPNQNAMAWLSGENTCENRNQIADEIDYFCSLHGPLRPTVFLCYDREAYYAVDGTDFRVTFDDTILCRQEELSLGSDPWGVSLLPEGMTLMEIKCSGGIPLWLTEVLSREKIYKTSYSKYGTAYKNLIFPQIHPQKITPEVTTNARKMVSGNL